MEDGCMSATASDQSYPDEMIRRFSSSLPIQGFHSDHTTVRNDRLPLQRLDSTSNNSNAADRFSTKICRKEIDSEASTSESRVRTSHMNYRNAGNFDECSNFYKNSRTNRDPSECGSSAGPLEQNDHLRRWNEMKKNGFISSSYGGIPAPKPKGKKSKNNTMRMKMEIARREQIDRFVKIAAPSGLLNGLNPGIINHVRNSKQVHSIIEALVKDGTKEREMKNRERIVPDRSNNLGRNESWREKYTRLIEVPRAMPSEDGFEHVKEDKSVLRFETDEGLKSTGFACDDDSSSFQSLPSLSFKAAMVASQWLDLLHQDIRGRLGALRRSKKRVRAVIHTEMPFLISKEFNPNEDNVLTTRKGFASEFRYTTSSYSHSAKWSQLFNQMERALTDEEQQLENWLNQVKIMQLRCEWGLRRYHPSAEEEDAQQLRISRRIFRSEDDEVQEKNLAVQAAAASIYSTCNFLPSTESGPS